MKLNNETKLEELKKKVNATNIIKEESLLLNTNSSLLTIGLKKSNIHMTKTNFSFSDSSRINNLKKSVEKKIADEINMTQEKWELELLIEEQKENQSNIRLYYGKSSQDMQQEIENIMREIENIKIHNINDKEKLEKVLENTEIIENDYNEYSEQNKSIETELRRLGDRTENKVKEMSEKLKQSIENCDKLKEEHEIELNRLKKFSTDRIRRLEEDYRNKLNDLGLKVENIIKERQDILSELGRLEDLKKRAEVDLESRIKEMKESFYEESFNQAQGLVRVSYNRLKVSQDNKEILQKKIENVLKELNLNENKFNEEYNSYTEENNNLLETLEQLRLESVSTNKELEDIKRQISSLEAEEIRINGEIARENSNLKSGIEISKQRLKEHINKYRRVTDEQRNKIVALRDNVKNLEEELINQKNKRQNFEIDNYNRIEEIRSQLNKAVAGTFGENIRNSNDSVIQDRSINQNYSQNY